MQLLAAVEIPDATVTSLRMAAFELYLQPQAEAALTTWASFKS